MQTKVPNRRKEKKRETSSEIIKEELQFLQAGVSNPRIWKTCGLYYAVWKSALLGLFSRGALLIQVCYSPHV